MKKRIKKLVIPFLLGSLLLCSCGISAANDASSIDMGKYVRPAEKLALAKMEMPEKQSTLAMQAVYVQYGREFLPIAFWQDGKSLLDYEKEAESGQRWRGHGELDHKILQCEKELPGEKFVIYEIGDDEQINKRTVDFETLKNTKIAEVDGSYNANNNIGRMVAASEGFASDFAAPVRHVEYTLENQQEVPVQYRQFVKDKLVEDGFYNTPIIIDEIWYVDLDGDGQEEAFVSSSNKVKCFSDSFDKIFHYTIDDNTPVETADTSQIAIQEGLGEYDFFFLYSETFSPIFFCEYPLNAADEYDENWSNTAVEIVHDQQLDTNILVTKQDETGENEPYGILYFYAKNGQIEPYMVLTDSGRFMSATVTSMQKPIILDWDGDGDYDVCIAIGEIYGLFEVYIQEDGKLEPQAGLHLPA